MVFHVADKSNYSRFSNALSDRERRGSTDHSTMRHPIIDIHSRTIGTIGTVDLSHSIHRNNHVTSYGAGCRRPISREELIAILDEAIMIASGNDAIEDNF